MLSCKIWDKKSSINRVNAKDILENRIDLKNAKDILLVLKGDIVIEIQLVETLKSIYNLDKELTAEQVAKEYLSLKEEEKQQAGKESNTLEEMGNKISILEAENQALKEEISRIQISLASLVSAIEK